MIHITVTGHEKTRLSEDIEEFLWERGLKTSRKQDGVFVGGAVQTDAIIEEVVGEWGDPIPVNGKRPEWVLDTDVVGYRPPYRKEIVSHFASDVSAVAWFALSHIQLLAEHSYYLATSNGFTYWPGGPEAPADWDGGECLIRNGIATTVINWWTHSNESSDIIGYRRKPVTLTIDDPEKGGSEPGAWLRELKRMARPKVAGPYSIGSDKWPGLSKLIEEAGEVVQVGGKLMQTPSGDHWSGDLNTMLVEEIGDLYAALDFFVEKNGLPKPAIEQRRFKKQVLFQRWHKENSDGR